MVTRSAIHQVAHVATIEDPVVVSDVFGTGRLTPLNVVTEGLSQAVTQSIQVAVGQLAGGELQKYVGELTNAVLGRTGDPSQLLSETNRRYRNILNDIGTKTATNIVDSLRFGAPVNRALNSLITTGKVTNQDELINQYMPNLRVVINNGDVKRLVTGDYNNAKDVASLLTSITGNTEIAKAFDVTAQFAVLNGVITKARALGIDQLLDTMLDQIDDEGDKQTFLLTGTSAAADGCDLSYLTQALQKSDRNAILAHTPDVVDRMLSSYKEGVPFDDFIAICDQIKPQWEKVERGSLLMDNLAVFAQASPTLLDAMRLHDRFRVAASIVGAFPANTIDGICQSLYNLSPY